MYHDADQSESEIVDLHKYSDHLEEDPRDSSHIMQRMSPTQPVPRPNCLQASLPTRVGKDDVRVDNVRSRGMVNKVCPSYKRSAC